MMLLIGFMDWADVRCCRLLESRFEYDQLLRRNAIVIFCEAWVVALELISWTFA